MSPLARTPVAWRDLLDLVAAGLVWLPWPNANTLDDLDPYLAWLDATNFVGSDARSARPATLPLLVKVSPQSARRFRGGVFGTLQAPPDVVMQFRRGMKSSPCKPPFLPQPIEFDAAATVGLPRVNGGASVLGYEPDGVKPGLPSTPSGPVIAVIDDGCPFARLGLRNGGTTRVLRLWDQGVEKAPLSSQPKRFLYGREWDRAQLDIAISRGRLPTQPDAVDEDACYAAIESDLVGGLFRHGAHMLGLAAGDPDPWRSDDDASAPDAAASAEVLFVQLPRPTMSDTSGGSLPIHVFDALRWIDDHTWLSENGSKTEIPVIVNLSVGASAGPHDGSSLIEQAVDAFLERRKHAIVVMPAGNGRGQRGRARWRVEPNQELRVPWDVAFDDATDSYLELWWCVADGQEPSDALLEIQLVAPGGSLDAEHWVRPGQAKFLFDEDRALPRALPVAGVVSTPSSSAKGDARCVLLCIAPTVGDGLSDRPLAVPGTWQVHVRPSSSSSASIVVDAWIERDDPSFGSRACQSAFGDSASALLGNDGTIGSLSNGRGPLVVGGYCFDRLHQQMGPLDERSGEGPGRIGYARPSPDLVAPSDEGGLGGILSWGVHSGEWLRLRGTSAAAAMVTRRIYNQWRPLYDTDSLPEGPAAIKAAFNPTLPFDPAEDPYSRVGRGRVVP